MITAPNKKRESREDRRRARVIVFRAYDEQIEAIDAIAAREQRTRSQMLRVLIDDGIKARS